MTMAAKAKWMATISVWKEGADRDADEDPADQQEQLASLECDTSSQAMALGALLAKHARNTSPGEFRLMKRVTASDVPDGYDWIDVEKPESGNEICDECTKSKPNVGPWEDGRRLCGGCKLKITFARPGAKERLASTIRTAFETVDGPDPLLPQCKKNAACYRANGHKGGCRRE